MGYKSDADVLLPERGAAGGQVGRRQQAGAGEENTRHGGDTGSGGRRHRKLMMIEFGRLIHSNTKRYIL